MLGSKVTSLRPHGVWEWFTSADMRVLEGHRKLWHLHSAFQALKRYGSCLQKFQTSIYSECDIHQPLPTFSVHALCTCAISGKWATVQEMHTRLTADTLLSCLIIRAIYLTRAQNYDLIGCNLLNERIMSSAIILT